MNRQFQFYIVPTPIGNLDDFSFRAIEILKSVDRVYCEDSRVTQKLLNHFEIKTKLVSYHKYNEKSRLNEVVSFLTSGKTAALVSDAGTPLICDPGSILLSELRKNNISYTSIPGACTIPVFLSQIPRDNEFFTFAGFFPKTEQSAKEILIKYRDINLVFYESPNRIVDTLKFIKDIRGNVKIAVSRELTKLFEETLVDTIDNVIAHFETGAKGEFVCMVYADTNPETSEINSKIKLLLDKGYKTKDISVILSTLYDVSKNEVYKRLTEK